MAHLTFPRFATAHLEEYLYEFSGATRTELARAIRRAASNAATPGLMSAGREGVPPAFVAMANDAARLPHNDAVWVGRIMRAAAPGAWAALAGEARCSI